MPRGDALIQDDASTYFVMNFGRGADDASGTNAVLIKEGVKTYSSGGGFKTVEAFASVALSKEETAVLNRVAAAFQKRAAPRARRSPLLGPGRNLKTYRARATDSNPYLEYLLAKCYLEGKGTEKDEKLGLEWMNRAAKRRLGRRNGIPGNPRTQSPLAPAAASSPGN